MFFSKNGIPPSGLRFKNCPSTIRLRDPDPAPYHVAGAAFGMQKKKIRPSLPCGSGGAESFAARYSQLV